MQKLCIMENERDLLEYEKKDVEKKLADQKADSELLRGQLRVCHNVLHITAMFIASFNVLLQIKDSVMYRINCI